MQSLNPRQDAAAGFRLAVLVEGGLGVVAVALAWLLRVPLREQFGTTSADAYRGVGRGIVATLPLLAGFWWLVHAQAPGLRQLRRQVAQLVREMFPQPSLVELGILAMLAGVTEELLFRGVLQTFVARWTTPFVGLAIASLVFGLFHAMSRLYFVLATAVGAYFGLLLLWYKDISVPMIAHGLYDLVALVYLTRILDKEAHHERPGD